MTVTLVREDVKGGARDMVGAAWLKSASRKHALFIRHFRPFKI
jgi:hypothetical protein